MRRDILRYSRWVGVVLLLALLVFSGCTRSKSSSPPTATVDEAGGQATMEPTDTVAAATATLPGGSPIAATTTAWANQTATAEAEAPEETEAAPTDTAEATEVAQATATATEVPEATEAPEATDTPEATQAPSTEERTHIVRAGENLFRIALSYGLSTQRLASYNGIANPNLIYVGQELKIPPSDGTGTTPPPQQGGGTVHVVQQGENLFRVALQYNMLFTELARANELSYPYTIYPGQRLVIPQP